MKSSKTIQLKSSNLGIFYRQYVELINPLLSLSNKQMDVLAALMHQNNQLSLIFTNPDNPLKWKALFSSDSRKEIAETVSMSRINLNNILKVLRDKKIITSSSIRDDLIVTPNTDGFHVVFNFNFQNNKDERSKAN